jgi:hypothetical protein
MLRAGLCQSTYPRGAEMQSGRLGWSFAYRSADNELHGVVPRGMEGLLFLGGEMMRKMVRGCSHDAFVTCTVLMVIWP